MPPTDRLMELSDGLWVEIEPTQVLGMPLSNTMSVVRLQDGTLLLHSLLPYTPERRAEVESLGKIAHLYTPSLFHGVRAHEWAAAFPEAKMHAHPALVEDHPGLRIDRDLCSDAHRVADPALEGVLEECFVKGFRLGETAVFHRPSRTLIVADLVHNVGRPTQPWAWLYTRVMGFYGRVGLSRALQFAAFSDRTAARRAIDQILEWPWDRLVVGHGQVIESNAKAAFTAAYQWLR